MQYILWLEAILLSFDFGLNQQGQTVIHAIANPLVNTIILNISVLITTWGLSIPLGIISAYFQNKYIDRLILMWSSLSITMPSFIFSIFIFSMGMRFGLADLGGLTSMNYENLSPLGKIFDLLSHLLLPVIVLSFVSMGGLIRQVRANILDTLGQDYIRSAFARGLPTYQILLNYALPNSINPLISMLGLELASLISGAALTEMILNYPGIGALMLEATRRMDINIIIFMLILGTVLLLLGNFASDILLYVLDPRIKKATSKIV
jgi:peptide/nickel transport system permease protein